MKKWLSLCLAILVALQGASISTAYAEDVTPSSTVEDTSTTNSSSSQDNTSGTDQSSTPDSSSDPSSSATTDPQSSTSVTNNSFTTLSTDQPVISLIGDETFRLKVGTPFSDPGTTVQDAVYSDLSATVFYTLNNVIVPNIDVNTPGSYTIHYNVTNPENQSADEVTRTVKVAAIGDFIGSTEFSHISLSSSRSMAYYGDYVYVAQRYVGISRVNLYTGKPETVVADSSQSFMGVAFNSQGDLFYTKDSDPVLHKISHDNLTSLPLSASTFNTNSTNYLTTTANYIYGLAIDKTDNIYFSNYLQNEIRQYNPSTQTTKP